MNSIEHTIPLSEINFYQKKAAEKIRAEKWEGRNIQQKIDNFVNCWVTEEAFKQILIKHGAFFRHRGLYFGDATGAGVDFEVKKNDQWTTIGIRSINEASLNKWKSVAYPEDRFLAEQEKIADYVIACHHNDGRVLFLGIIGKSVLLEELGKSKIKQSRANQELFRTVPLEKFSSEKLVEFLGQLDKR